MDERYRHRIDRRTRLPPDRDISVNEGRQPWVKRSWFRATVAGLALTALGNLLSTLETDIAHIVSALLKPLVIQWLGL